MTPQEFIENLKDHFWNKNKTLHFAQSQTNSMFDTIKSYLLKKNLVVVSKVEYESLVDFREKQYLKDLWSEQEDLY
jgi:hypothetical protein